MAPPVSSVWAWVLSWINHEKVALPSSLHEARLGATEPVIVLDTMPRVSAAGAERSSSDMRRPNFVFPVLSTRPRQVLSTAVQLALGAQAGPVVPVLPLEPLPPVELMLLEPLPLPALVLLLELLVVLDVVLVVELLLPEPEVVVELLLLELLLLLEPLQPIAARVATPRINFEMRISFYQSRARARSDRVHE